MIGNRKSWEWILGFTVIILTLLGLVLIPFSLYDAWRENIKAEAMQAEVSGDYDKALELYSKLSPEYTHRVDGERRVQHLQLIEAGICANGDECPCFNIR